MSLRKVDELVNVYEFKDEWPRRVAELIRDLARRCASLSGESAVEVAAYLTDVAYGEDTMHGTCVVTIDRDTTGRADHRIESSVDCVDLGRTLAAAAAERYRLPLTELEHVGQATSQG